MKKTEQCPIVHETYKDVTELIIRGAKGIPYSTYQKRVLGANPIE